MDTPDLTEFLTAATGLTDPTDRRREGRIRERAGITVADLDARVSALVGDLRTELTDAVGQLIRQELVARCPPTPPPAPTTDQGTSTDPPDVTWAQNHRTECWHIVSVGPGSGFPSLHWAAWCGWAFGRSPGYRLEQPSSGAERCPRCIDMCTKRTGRAVRPE